MLPSDEMSSLWDRLSYCALACAAAVITFTVGDYGLTWDEPTQHIYGDLVYSYYASGFADRQALDYRDLYLYGGAFDGFAAVLHRVFPGKPLEIRHALGAALGLLGIAATWRATRSVASPRAAFFALLLLATTPRWWGHSFNNPKDIPFAVGTIVSLYFLLRLIEVLPRPAPGLLLRLGVAIGLTLGVRAGGLVLFGYLGLVLALHWLLSQSRDARGAGRAAANFAFVAAPAWVVMLLCWPWAQAGPLFRPFEALLRLSQFQPYAGELTTLFAGKEISVVDVPASYGVHWLSITLPEGMLVLLAVGLWLAGLALFQGRVEIRSTIATRYALLGFAAVFPLGFVAASHSPLYDGMRQLLFVVPPLACLAGCALDALWDRAARWPAWQRRSALVACALYATLHLGLMLKLHPHQAVYFNQLVGGLGGAAGRYELDYWGNSYREATAILVEHLEGEAELRQRAGARRAIGPYQVFLCSAPQSGRHFFPKYLHSTLERSEADFMMATTRFGCHRRLAGREIGRVERLGTTLAVVTDRRAEALR